MIKSQEAIHLTFAQNSIASTMMTLIGIFSSEFATTNFNPI